VHTMVQRVIGALKLDVATYEEVEHDPAATWQAAILVAIIAIVSGLISGVLNADNFLTAVIASVFSGVAGWLVWSVVMWFIGTKVFKGEAELPEMLRVLGFAYAPALFMPIPCVNLLVLLWLLATGFVAVRAGLDLDNTKTLVTIVLGVIAVIAVSMAIAIPLGIGAALTGGTLG
jgi:hypothetical protein